MTDAVVATEIVDWESGVWCDACAIPSAYRLWFMTTTNGQSTLRSRTVCDGGHE